MPEHNDLASNMRYQTRLMGVSPLSMVPLNPIHSAWLLVIAKLHGLKAQVVPIFG